MDEYIKRADVLALAKCGAIISTDYDKRCRELINDIPAADVRPVVYGAWLPDGKSNELCICSNCGNIFDNYFHYYNGCPICLADMRDNAEPKNSRRSRRM